MRQPKKQISSPGKSESASLQPSAAIRSTSQLARELGLSRWTVSRVINGHPGIHPDTAERVRAAMEKHRFSPNPLAQGLRRGRTNVVGICTPGIEDYFLGPKLELLRHSLSLHRFQVMIGISGSDPESETTALDHFRRLCVAGVILFASRLRLKHPAIEQFREAGIPLVMVDPLTARHPYSLVIDRAHASRELMNHLLALGHRHFITLGMENAGLYTRARLAAIKTTLENAGLPSSLHLTHLPQIGDQSDYELGYGNARQIAETLRAGGLHRPTAILAINDRAALGMIEGLRQQGVAVPRDCSIVGYDNMEHTAYIHPRLTTIDPGAPELMERAAGQFLSALQPGGRPPRPVAVKPRLVVRETTVPPAAPPC